MRRNSTREASKRDQQWHILNRQRGPILLVLRTPPPFGGGELLGEALREYVDNLDDFIVLEVRAGKRSKASQGKLQLWKLWEFFRLWYKLIAAMLRWRPSLLFLPLAKSFPHFFRDSLFFWTSWLFRIPCAGELPGARFYFMGRGRFQTWYAKLILSRAACLRVLGRHIADELRDFGLSNTIVSDNGVLINCGSDDSEVIEAGQTFRILFVGTISQEKGFSDLTSACISLAHEGQAFEVNVLGEWISNDYRIAMERQMASSGIRELFTFHGLVHGERKSALYTLSDLLVLPSYTEGQPLVILEALGCGLPIIATNVGAIPDTIEDEQNGYLINPGDQQLLSKKIAFLMQHPEICRRMSIDNRRLYGDRFTQQRFLKTQVSWLRKCASRELIPNGQLYRII